MERSGEMKSLPTVAALVRARTERLADWLAVGVGVLLPWSTTAAGIFIALWLIACLATLNVNLARREVKSAAGGLPVLLWLFALLGTLWADVTWSERFAGLGGFNRLLFIPILIAQFRYSGRGHWVLYGYLASVTLLLLVSWALVLLPGLSWRGRLTGLPVKDYIAQSAEFLICAFALLGSAIDRYRKQNWRDFVWSAALASLFLANIAFVVAGRTAYLTAPVLLLLLGWRISGLKGLLSALLLGCTASALVWLGSPYLRDRVKESMSDLHAYYERDAGRSTGIHLELLKKSLHFVATAPVTGHGTGSIAEQFRNAVAGETGVASLASDNPHNQIFAVAIQLGLIGAAVLLAMWIAHFMLFRGSGSTAWIGTVVVTETVMSSLVNSSLFNFSEGWLYVFGVGVIGGMTLRAQDFALLETSHK
jgi:O-antigen ligase